MNEQQTDKKRILLGIGGGVAAFKAVQVASSLVQQEHDVHVAMTQVAKKFIAPLSFAAVTHHPVLEDMFPEIGTGGVEDIYPHLYPATEVDVCVLLPATADMIAKVTHGFGSDIVTASVLSLPAKCQRYYCPAMNVEMWQQQTVQQNVMRMGELGWHRIGPEQGHLACGVTGEGRFTEPDRIVDRIVGDLNMTGRLKDKRILITSGPTVEHIDPVRFISNRSTGIMGKELALAAMHAGAVVDFISGPVVSDNIPRGAMIKVRHVRSAKEMLYEAENSFPGAEVAIFVAAVADYMPVETNASKLAKHSGEFALKLESTPDIAATLGAQKSAGQVCVGFALETDPDAIDRAKEKMKTKNLDAIVLNGVKSLGSYRGHFVYLSGNENVTSEEWGHIDKATCARQLINKITVDIETFE